MPVAQYYSPRISRPLVSLLYHEAKREGIPMTRLVDRIIATQLGGKDGHIIPAEGKCPPEVFPKA